MDGEELYADMLDVVYGDMLDAAREQLDMPLGPELGGSEQAFGDRRDGRSERSE